MCFSSGVYLYFRILMYVKRHERFEIGRSAILNKLYYYYIKYYEQWYQRHLISQDIY